MPPALSIYLDVIRFTAAFTVFLGHVSGERLTGGLRGLWRAGQFADNAVIAFFVLSEFVIAHVVDGREKTPRTYAISRLARIYSVALPALITTLLLDTVGRTIDAQAYNIAWGYVDHDRPWQFLSGLLFVNQLWFSNVSPGSDLPYWSLGFEVWYYLIFGLAVFAPSRLRWALAFVAVAVAGPRIALLFPIWLLGIVCYRSSGQQNLSPRFGLALWAGTIVAYAAYTVLLQQHVVRALRLLTADRYLVGACFAMNIAGFRLMSPLLAGWLQTVAGPVRWVAGATFTLYLFHMPVAQLLSILAPWPAASLLRQFVVVGGTLAIVLLIAQLTERRKELWRRGMATGLFFIIGTDPPRPLLGIPADLDARQPIARDN